MAGKPILESDSGAMQLHECPQLSFVEKLLAFLLSLCHTPNRSSDTTSEKTKLRMSGGRKGTDLYAVRFRGAEDLKTVELPQAVA